MVSWCGSGPSDLGNFITANWLKDESSAADLQLSEILSSYADRYINVDIHDFAIFLLELISGKNADVFLVQRGQTLKDWARPFLASESVNEFMDQRLDSTGDTSRLNLMVDAAQLCLNNNPKERVNMSKVIAVLRNANLSL